MKHAFLAIDVGTQSSRTLVFDAWGDDAYERGSGRSEGGCSDAPHRLWLAKIPSALKSWPRSPSQRRRCGPKVRPHGTLVPAGIPREPSGNSDLPAD